MTKETYVKKIKKGLKCTNAKKKEIAKQLEAEIMAEISGGVTLESIIARMGTPDSVAKEFNENFSSEEQKAAVKAKRIKLAILVLLILVFIVAAVYWRLPKGSTEINNFDEEKVKERVELVIDLVDDGDYEQLEKYSIEKMKTDSVKEAIEQTKNTINSNWGKRLSFGTMYQAEIKQMGTTCIVTQVNVSYENVSITYTITLDEDLLLMGLYMK